MTTWPASESLIRQMRAELGPRCVLAFSGGKDAIAAYLALRPHFDEVIPFHLFLVPGLEFVEEILAEHEKLIGRHIIRLPHSSLYRWLNNLMFQPPAHAAVIVAAKLPDFDYQDIYDLVAEAEGLDPSKILVANGVRAADSPIRRLSISQHGPVTRAKRQWMPIWDWRKDDVIDAIAKSEFRLGKEYLWFGRSFDGLDLRFLLPLKKHAPRDYARILEVFPFAALEVWRYERFGQAA